MLVYLITSDTEEKKPVFLIQYQRKLIFSYITLSTVQNYPNPSVYIIFCASRKGTARRWCLKEVGVSIKVVHMTWCHTVTYSIMKH